MAIQLIDNFELSVTKPIDNRIVVGPGLTYTTKEGIPLPYAGMRIYDLNDNTAWVYKGTSWSADVEKISIQSGSQFATQSYLTFVSALSGINLVYSFANFRINPANGQLIGPTGTNANPTYGFTTSSATSFMGMWKSANDSLAFSIAGTKYFEIGTTGITASNSLRISNTSGSTNTVGGGSLILNAGTNKNFEFYSLSNDSLFRIYNSSSARILPGESTTATDRTLELQNETSRSIMKVRDYHRIRTHSGTGVISLGDGTNDDFVFYMNGWTLSGSTNLTGTFSSSGGGLNIKNNLRVGRSTTLGGTVSISGNVGVSGLIRVSNGTQLQPSISFINSTGTGLYRPDASSLGLVVNQFEMMKLSPSEVIAYVHNTGGGTGSTSYPSLASGEYTPTFTGFQNILSFMSITAASWMRVGNVVHVSGRVNFSTTNANAVTRFSLTLPTPNDMYALGTVTVNYTYYLNGVGTVDYANGQHSSAFITGHISEVAEFNYYSILSGATTVYYTFQYQLVDAINDAFP